MTAFELSYDYRCPFAKNIHLHMVSALKAGGKFDVTFVPWTMSQGHRPEGSPDVWENEKYNAELLALAVSTSIRDQQPDLFLDAHDAMFRGRHEKGVRLVNIEEIDGLLSPLGVDMQMVRDDVASRRPHQVIGESFKRFEKVESFGVPTFVIGNDATFVRYMNGPTSDAQASIAVIESLVSMMANQPEINEFKHTRAPM